MYYILFPIIYLFSLLPFRVMFLLSDMTFPIVYHCARYRRKITRKNLIDSFPEKSIDEIVDIEKKFYHWFCDYIFETLKLFSISEKEMRKRMVFEGIEQCNEVMRRNRSITMFLGHYCNWEWVSSLALHLDKKFSAVQLYHPLENATFDRLILYARGRFGNKSIYMKDGFRILSAWQKEGHYTLTGFISDQVPGFSSMHYWPMFLNHKTATYTGGERIAKILNTEVFYFDIYRPKRGYYVAKLIKITDKPQEEEKHFITSRYYQLLEKSIIQNPHLWLWSHNRWKRTWEDFVKTYPDETERERILNKL